MLKKMALLISFSMLLTACVPVAFVAGASAGGAIVYDKRDMKTMVQDRNLSNAILAKINSDPQLKKQTHISVATFDRIVLLAGQAPTQALKDQVYSLASSVPNTKRLYNEITIEPPTSKLVQTNDAWLTTKVKTAMLAEKGLNSTQIKVVTENSVVYLMGITSRKQADIAANVASHIDGVKRVVKLFEYE